jgi:hypothetical protein
MNYSILKQTYGRPFDANDAVPHYVCARIESKDYLLFQDFSHDDKIGSLYKLLK